MKTVEIVKGPHLLYQGANGYKTYGITVRTLEPIDDVERKGYQRTWDLNVQSMMIGNPYTHMDMSYEEYSKIQIEALDMENRANMFYCELCKRYDEEDNFRRHNLFIHDGIKTYIIENKLTAIRYKLFYLDSYELMKDLCIEYDRPIPKRLNKSGWYYFKNEGIKDDVDDLVLAEEILMDINDGIEYLTNLRTEIKKLNEGQYMARKDRT